MTSLISNPLHIGTLGNPKRVGCHITEPSAGLAGVVFQGRAAFGRRSSLSRCGVNLCIANDTFLICAKANGVLMAPALNTKNEGLSNTPFLLMQTAPPLLQLREITKSFQAVRALKGVSFDLHRGEVHALLGENGAGKSTLIKVITGAHQPDSGTIEIEGKPVARLDPATARAMGIAAIYQQPALFPDLSVAENIALGLETPSAASRIAWGERRNQARQFLKRIGAEIEPETEVRNLSMPEQQLVEIARSLGAGARILIMDEPTASLTQKEVHLLYSVVRDLREHGVGVIYISHRMEEIFALADRVTVLRDGESIATQDTMGMNESTLIKLMVGREVSTLYPPSEASPADVALSVRGVGCEESGVHDVNLDLRAGEVVGFAGIVGAGRTELARVLFGITPADKGTISLAGKKVSIRSPREAVEHGIGYVPEDRRRHGVILEMPVAANMTMSIHPTFFPGSWLRFGAERDLAKSYIRDLGVKTPSTDAPGERTLRRQPAKSVACSLAGH